ncbi:hypothetical protein [Actinomadura rupiterrae]|uniref:hypothetical protein n=1 Tax=Actinomadura rupiterrae TaxID=559627 RepID=UPI0020A2CE9F|nr:hypothetical protein [Actinomadura rupiterrae]MCP2338089.1 hypothetical protein [Actinomadura rupiterrae]
MIGLSAGWAVRGKAPGSYDDYGILGSGGSDFGADDFTAILDRYTLGNPPPERGGPEALPWISLTEVLDDRGSYLGVAIHDWTDATDAAGRPIVRTRYGCFPYDQFVQAPVSYASLVRAVSGLGADGFAPNALDVPAYAPEDIVRDIEDHNWLGRAATTAALLLEGPVTIVGADDLDHLVRLRFLDAVAALLPFGWRPRFTAATWLRGGNSTIRLTFAYHPRPGDFELDWRVTEPQPPSDAPLSLAYARELRRTIAHRSLLEVVAYLSRRCDSMVNVDPNRIYDLLVDLDRPALVLDRVRRNEVDASEVAALLESGRYKELPRKSDHELLLAALIRLGGGLQSVQAVWHELGVGVPSEPWRAVTGEVLRRVRNAEDATPYLHLAEALGHTDELLAEVAGSSRDPRLGLAPVQAAANLIARWTDPFTANRPSTLRALRGHSTLICALIGDLDAGDVRREDAWLDLLAGFAPDDLLHPFRVLRVSDMTVSPQEIGAFAKHGADCVALLVGSAARRGRLDRLAAVLIRWVTGLPASERAGWLGRLHDVQPTQGADAAVLDVLRMSAGQPPVHLEAADRHAYTATFRQLVTDESLRRFSSNIQHALVEHMRDLTWAHDPDQVAMLLALTEALCAVDGQNRSAIVEAVVRGRAANPDMSDWPVYGRWWPDAAARYPGIAADEYRTVLCAVPYDAPVHTVGRLIAEATARGMAPMTLLRHLDASFWPITGPALLAAALEARMIAMHRYRDPQGQADEAMRLLIKTAHDASENLGRELRDAVDARLLSELTFPLNLTEATSLTPSQDEIEISDRTRGTLEAAESKIRSLQGRRTILGRRKN